MNGTREELRARLLAEYAIAPESSARGDTAFRRIAAGNVMAALALGALLLTVEVAPAVRLALDAAAPTPFRVAANLAAPTAPKPPVREETPAVLPAVVRPDESVAALAEVTPDEAKPSADVPAPPRRVYGVRKVFAHGLGTGSAGGDGLVVKRGNTLDGRADTLDATEDDLRAAAVPLAVVDQAPVPIRQVKPGYSTALLEQRATGVVSARLLIEADGSVSQVVIVEDIGFDSGEVAAVALRQFRFRPALRGGQAVPVWIVYKIRFEFQE